MITNEEYDRLPDWFKPQPIRLNPSQIKHKALKCQSCGAIFAENERLQHFEKEPEGRIVCPVARDALTSMRGRQ